MLRHSLPCPINPSLLPGCLPPPAVSTQLHHVLHSLSLSHTQTHTHSRTVCSFARSLDYVIPPLPPPPPHSLTFILYLAARPSPLSPLSKTFRGMDGRQGTDGRKGCVMTSERGRKDIPWLEAELKVLERTYCLLSISSCMPACLAWTRHSTA